MSRTFYVDADDFHEGNDGAGVLGAIRARNPAFQITLFTIPALCSRAWLERMKAISWLRLVPHGWRHQTSRECQSWTYQQMIEYLDRIEPLGLEHGFKAPGWQLTMGVLCALRDRGYWVADQHYNDERRPERLVTYYPNDPTARHFHIGGAALNNIALSYDQLSAMTEANFGFLGDAPPA